MEDQAAARRHRPVGRRALPGEGGARGGLGGHGYARRWRLALRASLAPQLFCGQGDASIDQSSTSATLSDIRASSCWILARQSAASSYPAAVFWLEAAFASVLQAASPMIKPHKLLDSCRLQRRRLDDLTASLCMSYARY